MSTPRAPKLEARRTPEFTAELLARARAWLPGWNLPDGNLGDDEADFGHALLKIAARFNSEVAERLDDAGEKMRRGFLDWLGVRGQAARPARLPVVFKLTDSARTAVLATAPVRLQADAAGTPVVFETETDVRVVPGRLAVVVAVDAEHDAYYLPPPGLSELDPLETLPTQWQLKSFAAAGATKLQLEPEAGLLPGTLITAANHQYRIVQADQNLITIEPPLLSPLTTLTTVTKVTSFAPYVGQAHNWQEHALYLGDAELLNLETAARLEIVGARALRTGITWEYWGKNEELTEGKDEVGWQPLRFDDVRQKTLTDALALTKPKGTVELRDIGGKNSRWIRAYVKKASEPFTSDEFSLKINAEGCDKKPSCPPNQSFASPMAEAMANTMPLVLSEAFYPLGREPRQFDAFYLGCAEAFSKKGAEVQVCFEMSDATCLAYTAVPGGKYANVLAGVGKDRALHLFKLNALGVMTQFHGPLRPPLPAAPDAPQVTSSAPIELNLRCRPVIWNTGNDFFVAVAAGGNIWIWHENDAEPKQSGWKPHSKVQDLSDTPAQIEDIIVLKSSPKAPKAVLSNGRFYVFDSSTSTWNQPSPGTPLRDYAALVPIYDANVNLTDSIVAVSTANELYRLEIDGTETAIAPGLKVDVGTVSAGSALLVDGIRPAAIDDGTCLRVVAVGENRDELVAVKNGTDPQYIPLGTGVIAIGAEVTIEKVLGTWLFYIGAKSAADNAFVLSVAPTFVATEPTIPIASPIPNASGNIGGTPLILGTFIVVPGARGDVFVARFNRLSFMKVIGEGLILPAAAPFAVGDFISVMPQKALSSRKEWQISNPPSASGDGEKKIYVVDKAFGESVADKPELLGYKAVNALPGTISDSTNFKPDSPDTGIVKNMILRIVVGTQSAAFCEVKKVSGGVVETKAPLPATSGALTYWKPIPEPMATVTPAIEFQPTGDGNWDAAILTSAKLYFPAPLQPSPQQASAFGVVNSHPTVVVLAKRWTSPPLTAPTPFVIDNVINTWRQQLTDTSSNPALSWEYWNGKGWWSLEIADGTARLASTGAVKFIVPPDMAESDWSGKTNFWIRSRLVGGDYGREEVTVITKPKPGSTSGETEQTIERSTANIRAPQVLNLHISYSICKGSRPQFVLSQDSGTLRDQSDANRTLGAIVEAFVPLAHLLARLAAGTVATTAPAAAATECDCGRPHAAATETSATTTGAVALATPVGNRALFIGLAATPAEAPVNLLLLVDEPPHTAFASLTVRALVADRFVPIVADDATRALSESGLLSMVFAVPPTPHDLFGQTGLTWLQLAPRTGADGEWNPVLRGAYLNAVWARATETLTRELLGSSDGSPNLMVRLARPPVLRDTLELRVKEPLGAEERDALLVRDANSVLRTVEGLPGDWVLWKQVPDPDDEPANARVYALDEVSGEIRFGDGQHGKIPPIGRDAIVAFRYGRTEPDPTGGDRVPGNSIAARTALNLVSPVESVERVTTAQQAAGGAPPEADERVLRFGFARVRHRGRAVTARDLEDLALQSSPDIVQARALPRTGYTQLIVVMRGPHPLPNAAQVRELQGLLLDVAPLALRAPGALRIAGPKLRRLRIELKLLVERLDRAGMLAEFVKTKLTNFFDTATGGPEQDGWALSSNPTEDDIAFALLDAPFLESIEKVTLNEIMDDGQARLWQVTPQATELVLLDVDPFRIEFAPAEVTG